MHKKEPVRECQNGKAASQCSGFVRDSQPYCSDQVVMGVMVLVASPSILTINPSIAEHRLLSRSKEWEWLGNAPFRCRIVRARPYLGEVNISYMFCPLSRARVCVLRILLLLAELAQQSFCTFVHDVVSGSF